VLRSQATLFRSRAAKMAPGDREALKALCATLGL
jgi:hypothetical protein